MDNDYISLAQTYFDSCYDAERDPYSPLDTYRSEIVKMDVDNNAIYNQMKGIVPDDMLFKVFLLFYPSYSFFLLSCIDLIALLYLLLYC